MVETTEESERRPNWMKRAWSALLAGLGWLLSPMSWWNDLLVNVPLAYLFAVPFSLFDERLYVPAFVLGYGITNVLGFVLLHKGVVGVVSSRKSTLKKDLLVATAYIRSPSRQPLFSGGCHRRLPCWRSGVSGECFFELHWARGA